MNPCGSSGDLLEASRFQILEKINLRVWADFPYFPMENQLLKAVQGCICVAARGKQRQAETEPIPIAASAKYLLALA